MSKKLENKWVRAAIPALLLHCSIGTVYCWSLVSESIATAISTPEKTISKSSVNGHLV